MNRQASKAAAAAVWRALCDESGQAMTEYASITVLMLFTCIAAGASFPFSKALFNALQTYISFYFYALNAPLG